MKFDATAGRRSFLCTLCLLAGAVTTVGVAWFAAWAFDVVGSDIREKNGPVSLEPPRYINDWGGQWTERAYDSTICFGRVAARRYSTSRDYLLEDNVPGEPDCSPLVSSMDGASDPSLRLPTWVSNAMLAVDDTECVMVTADEYGWPLPALGWFLQTKGWPPQGSWGIPLPARAVPQPPIFGSNAGDRALPLLPLWPGLLANTAIYALLWAVSVLMLPAVRRRARRRRGRCVRCNYEVLGLDTCPECGTLVPSAPKELV